jgi:uncharacterized protein (DUF433 family)
MPLPLPVEAPPLREQDGALRVGRSSVTLETVVWAFHDGASPERIVEQFPTLDLADVYAVIAYYLRHRADVDAYVERRAQLYERQTDEVRRTFPQALTRAELQNRVKR